jgi:beta-lactamase class A
VNTEPLAALAAELGSLSAAYSGKCTWALTELVSGAHISHDEDDVMPAASLIKVPVLVALYQAVDEGRVAIDQRTTYEERHRSLGSGVLSMMSPGVEMTVRDAAVLMMTISDNSATNMCVDLAGLDGVNAKMRALGLPATSLFRWLGDRSAGLDARKMSVSTAGEMANLLALIARRRAVSPGGCDDMLRIMRRMRERAELSHLLPWNEMNTLPDPRQNWVAEKGGAFMNGIRTGGAIFHSERGSFVMAVFCEGGLRGPGNHLSEGNALLERMGKAAWDALCAPS